MELIRGTLQLVISAVAVLLVIIALCADADGGIRRKKMIGVLWAFAVGILGLSIALFFGRN